MSQFVVAIIQCSDVTVLESAGIATVQCERRGPFFSNVSFTSITVNGTATG